MSKSKREIQREIYNFIADQDKPIIQQELIDKFCKKYVCSTRAITRYLEEMTTSRNPFHLRTWYDRNRYYEVPTISMKGQILSILSVAIPFCLFFVDLYNIFSTQWHLFVASTSFIVGFWIAMWISVISKEKRHFSAKKISEGLNSTGKNK